MALEDTLRSLREFDVNDLSLDNIGTLPVADQGHHLPAGLRRCDRRRLLLPHQGPAAAAGPDPGQGRRR
jgi:hypothetical protein